MDVDKVLADSVDPVYEAEMVRLAKTTSTLVFPFELSPKKMMTEIDETPPLFKVHSQDMGMTVDRLGDDVHEAYTRRAHEVLNFLQVEILERCEKREEEKYTIKIYLAKKRLDTWFIAEVYDAS